MATIDIPELTAFVTVVRAGSFTRAAILLDSQKAHLSRVVARLEQQLGARLLERSTRALRVTEIGREVFERAVGIIEAVDATEAAAAQARAVPTGRLTITCGVEFGLLVVSRWVADFLKRYEGVTVEADYTNRVVDIIHEGIDVAIRIGALPDSTLQARRLGEIEYALYASPDYLRRSGPLRATTDLAKQRHVVFTPGGRQVWSLIHKKSRRTVDVRLAPRFIANNNIAARDATAAGLGVGLLPRFQAEPLVASDALVEVLPGWSRLPAPVHAVFTSTRYMAPKVRAFVDFAIAEFRSENQAGSGDVLSGHGKGDGSGTLPPH